MAVRAINYTVPRLDLGVALEEYPLGFTGFVASEVLPVLPVPEKAGKLTVLTRESALRPVDVVRSVTGSYPRADYETDEIDYRCEEYGLEAKLPDEQQSFYGSAFNAQLVTAALSRDRLAREREKRVAAAFFNTTTFTGASLFTDLAKDWDDASALIVDDVMAAKETVRKNCGLVPNTIIIPAGAMPWLKKNTDLKARLMYVNAVTEQAIVSNLAGLFGIPRVIVAGAVYNTGGEGDAFSSADVWNDNYCWLGVCATGQNFPEPCIGRTLLWANDSPSEFTVEEYREEQTRSWVYRVRHHLQEKIFDPMFGHLLQIDT